MTTHKFEHPLNEKTRIYLRVESLLRQAHLASGFSENHQYQLFFVRYSIWLKSSNRSS